MANIAKYLIQIMKARYGRDVRQSIHDAIDAVNSGAEGSASAAEAAQMGAETAREAAEAAQTGVETAREAAEAAQTGAETAREAAEAAQTGAETAREAAEAAQTGAETAREAAEAAQTGAETAREAAEAAQTGAKTAREAAEAAQTGAETAQEKSEASQEAAEAAQEGAETGKTAAETAQAAAEAAQTQAEFYAEQCRQITEGLAGAILPLGTITSSELLSLSMENVKSGYMYNISNEFVTTEAFREGAGKTIAAGSNVYMTADGKWDVLAGTPVTGVKGDKETYYRRGNVNITPKNIGALADTGGEISGDLTLKKYLILKAWTGYGSGDVKAWYDGNTKTLKLEGNVQNIDLNATSATKAAQDGEGNIIKDTYLPLAGGEISDNLTLKRYLIIKAWEGYGSGEAMAWYDGNTKTLKFGGDVKNIDLNATSATKAAQDGEGNIIADTYLPLAGGTLHGDLNTKDNYIYTGNEFHVNDYEIDICLDDADYISALKISQTDKNFEVSPNCFNSISKNLGSSSNKWNNIFATNGTIQTSDRKEKNTVEELTAEKAQKLIYGLKPSTYQMNSGTSGRTHWGMISQDIEELLEELGWTSLDFAGFIKSPKIQRIEKEIEDPETGKIIKKIVEEVIEGEYDYSLRYDEFIAPMIKVMQSQHEKDQNQNKRIGELETRIELLEQKLLSE